MDGMVLTELRFYRVRTEPPSGRRFFAIAWFLPPGLRETQHAGLLIVIEEYTSRWDQWEVSLPRGDAGEPFPEELLSAVVEDSVRAEYLDSEHAASAQEASLKELIMLARRGWAKRPLALAAQAAGGIQAFDQLAREAMRAASVELKHIAGSEKNREDHLAELAVSASSPTSDLSYD